MAVGCCGVWDLRVGFFEVWERVAAWMAPRGTIDDLGFPDRVIAHIAGRMLTVVKVTLGSGVVPGLDIRRSGLEIGPFFAIGLIPFVFPVPIHNEYRVV